MNTTPTPLYYALIAKHNEFDPARLTDVSLAAVLRRAKRANAKQRRADAERGRKITQRLREQAAEQAAEGVRQAGVGG